MGKIIAISILILSGSYFVQHKITKPNSSLKNNQTSISMAFCLLEELNWTYIKEHHTDWEDWIASPTLLRKGQHSQMSIQLTIYDKMEIKPLLVLKM